VARLFRISQGINFLPRDIVEPAAGIDPANSNGIVRDLLFRECAEARSNADAPASLDCYCSIAGQRDWIFHNPVAPRVNSWTGMAIGGMKQGLLLDMPPHVFRD
jgi:hypothetical protein